MSTPRVIPADEQVRAVLEGYRRRMGPDAEEQALYVADKALWRAKEARLRAWAERFWECLNAFIPDDMETFEWYVTFAPGVGAVVPSASASRATCTSVSVSVFEVLNTEECRRYRADHPEERPGMLYSRPPWWNLLRHLRQMPFPKGIRPECRSVYTWVNYVASRLLHLDTDEADDASGMRLLWSVTDPRTTSAVIASYNKSMCLGSVDEAARQIVEDLPQLCRDAQRYGHYRILLVNEPSEERREALAAALFLLLGETGWLDEYFLDVDKGSEGMHLCAGDEPWGHFTSNLICLTPLDAGLTGVKRRRVERREDLHTLKLDQILLREMPYEVETPKKRRRVR